MCFYLYGIATWNTPSEVYIKPCQTSTTEHLAKIVNGLQIVNLSAKTSICLLGTAVDAPLPRNQTLQVFN